MRLDEEQATIRETARRYAQEQLLPHAATWDELGDCPETVVGALAALGFMGLLVPERWGGAGASHLINAIVMEEIAAGCGGVSTLMHVHNFACATLADLGSDEQRARFLPAMTRGATVGAFCLTEPQGGSDTAMIRTSGRRDRDFWALDGTKQFITNGRRAGVALVMAVTDRTAGRHGVTLFIVPTGTPGFRVGRIERKMGQRCSDTAEIFLEDCRVPEANVLGALGGGYAQALASLSAGRISVGAQAVGMARAAYESALDYAQQRSAFGKTIVQHQAIAFRLADMLTKVEIARQYVHHAASLLDAGIACDREAAIAKCYAAEMAESVCSDAISIFGGYGYIVGCPVERIYRDVRVCQIYEGTGDIQRVIISRDLASR